MDIRVGNLLFENMDDIQPWKVTNRGERFYIAARDPEEALKVFRDSDYWEDLEGGECDIEPADLTEPFLDANRQSQRSLVSEFVKAFLLRETKIFASSVGF